MESGKVNALSCKYLSKQQAIRRILEENADKLFSSPNKPPVPS